MTKYVIIIVALLGLALGIWTVSTSGRKTPPTPPVAQPSVNPYPQGIAADGLVEAKSREVDVAAPEPGLVTAVFVQVNDHVKKGQKLFQLDRRSLEADLTEAKAAKRLAQAELQRLEAAPRKEDVPISQAAVDDAQASLAFAKSQYTYTQSAYGKGAATRQELDRQKSQYDAALARLEQAKAQLAKLKAGSWQQDIDVAKQQVNQAAAKIDAVNQRLARLTVRAPLDATVLKRNIEPGEYTSAAEANAPLILGDLSELQVRAKVDEEDISRLQASEPGIARVRGAAKHEIPLTMLRIEPLAEPKTQLTGVPTQLVDTRVLDVVFKVDNPHHKDLHIYPGQLVDVFIKAPKPAASEPATMAGP